MLSNFHSSRATRQRGQGIAFDDTLNNPEDTIALRFERQVAAIPDELALTTDENSLTYRALDLEASRVAAVLTSLPCPHNQPIVLFIKDEATRIRVMMGALKAGRIFIPVMSNAPANWIAQIIEDSGAALIIVDRFTRSIAELGTRGDVIFIEIDQFAQLSEPFVADRTVSPEDTAYIVYTSGSTGRPKGVANSHRSMMRRIDIRQSLFRIGRGDRHANLRSSGVSAGINETFLPLLSGGCLLPFDPNRCGLHKLTPWIIDQKITYVPFSGSLLRTWLATLPHDLRFSRLRIVWTGGEALYAQDVLRLSRHLTGDWRVGHSYSSTECGTITAQVLTPSNLSSVGDTGTVAGRPVDGVEACVVNETGALVSPGDIGEIIVRSRFLAQGYWNNPELTEKTFKIGTLDRAIRSFQTGDLGRWRSDGTLEHMGRKGRRIRLRGYSIEPFQVESELMCQPDVTDAVVVLHDGITDQEPCLVGYVVAPANVSPAALRKGLAERLPSYMVPSHIAVLDQFPIASSGKIDIAALPPPAWDEARPAVLRTPSDDREHELLKIWQEVLKIPNIGIGDDFFELGGTSLQALMVFSEIEARLGHSLSPTTIVQAPTIARLADFIRTSADANNSHSLVPLRATGKGQSLFLVHNRYCFVMYYRHLLSALRSGRPVFGLQPPPLDGSHHIPRTVETMAADYVLEIRRAQPSGPYFLAGHSFGGLVSFEIAQQLVRAGESVSFLGLIDTILVNPPSDSHQDLARRLRVGHRLFAFFEKLNWISEIARQRWYVLRLSFGQSIPYDHRTTLYDWVCRRAGRNYVPKSYAGHITMFSSVGNSERQKAHWGPLATGGLTIFEIAATHDDIVLPPYSKLLAKHFDDCLDKTGAFSDARS